MQSNRARYFASAALIALVASGLAGCKTTQSSDATGSIGMLPPSARSEAEWRREIDIWGPRYREKGSNAEAAINYAQALRATGQRSQAVAVLEQAAIQNPQNQALLGAYGRALADTGNHKQALDVLSRAHSPDQPDWRILSVQGAVLDQMGRHDEAQRHYSAALKIMPGEPSVMSNLGLSYALSKNLPEAESTLRQASTRSRDQKVRQNLALVVGLQGRFAEAEQIAREGLPPEEAAANVVYLRQMMAQQDESKKPRPAAKKPRANERG